HGRRDREGRRRPARVESRQLMVTSTARRPSEGRRAPVTGVGGVAGLIVLALSCAVTVTIGPAELSVVDVCAVIFDRLRLDDSSVTAIREGIVWELRLPRTLLAAVCGAGLAVCGAIMQSLLRNPLADPFVLGISSGASTGAVMIAVLGIGGGAVSLSGGAFLGA